MPYNRIKALGAAITIAAIAAAITVSLPASIGAQEYQETSSKRTLQGTWWVNVTVHPDCQSKAALLSFGALLTFARGGTMTGTTSNPGFAIGQRSPDHGVWSRTHKPHTYQASSVALVLFSTAPNPPVPGFQAGSQRIDQNIEVTDPDHFTSDAVTRFFDTSGNKYRELCATALGSRFE